MPGHKAMVFIMTALLLFSCALVMHGPVTPSSGGANSYDTSRYGSLFMHADVIGRYFSFTPDGESLVYIGAVPATNDTPGLPTISLIDLQSQEVTNLFINSTINTSTGYSSPPKMHPAGDRIVFGWSEGAALLHKNGSSWNGNVSSEGLPISGVTPSFSPDGRHIVFRYNKDGGGDVYRSDMDGSNKTRITASKMNALYPTCSPDGTMIAYQPDSERGNTELWVVNADGTGQKRLLDDSWYPAEPTFAPNGKILFASSRTSPYVKEPSGAKAVWMIDPDGGNPMVVMPASYGGHGGHKFPQMSPNGTRIIADHGFAEMGGLFYIDDPDGDGIWEDSDGDGVADVCDGAPDDPDAGYPRDPDTGDDDDDGDDSLCFGNMIGVLLIATPAALVVRRS